MLDNYAVRITHPWESVARIVKLWSGFAKRIAVYEHNDDGANNIHCHLHLEDVSCTSKNLQIVAKTSGVPLLIEREGQRATSLMSFRGKEYDKHVSGYAYLTKGKYEPKYLQGWTTTDTDSWKAAWVTPKNHVKRTELRILFDKFRPSAPKKPELPDPMTLSDTQLLRYEQISKELSLIWLDALSKQAYSFCMKEEHGQWCHAITKRVESIVRTHSFELNISIPKGYRFS